jgi:chemotaxis protein CheZ
MVSLPEVDVLIVAEDRQGLFDSAAMPRDGVAPGEVAAAIHPASVVSDAEATEMAQRKEVFQRVGHMARELREVLRDLGYLQLLEQAAHAIPDARERLRYIAQLTEQAAIRVLNAADVARPIQEHLASRAQDLDTEWGKSYAFGCGLEEFHPLGKEIRSFLAEASQSARTTNEQLLEIMMAQDFQDLTGQVINKIMKMARSLEEQLLQLLLDLSPDEFRSNLSSQTVAPAFHPEHGTEVMAGQEQVNELLEMLGF